MAYSEAFAKCAERGLVPQNYLQQGLQTAKTREKMFRHLFEQRKLPENGWDDQTIEILLNELAAMDSNNFLSKGGVGEREGRIYSHIVARRHFGMAHGIGRSGDLAEAQPKAAGSTLLSTLTNALVLDLLRMHVSNKTVDACVLPMATGMSIALCLQTFKDARPGANFVIWSRIDQKSCFKAILTAGLVPIVVEPVLRGEELQTDVEKIASIIQEKGHDSILCAITTTSCFAPRAPDNVKAVAEMCKDTPIFHLVNNAYGIQSSKCCHAIDEAQRTGRVDIFIQSTDKNLMVPVGGAIVGSFTQDIMSQIRKSYPGRASCSQSMDVFITLLSMGTKGYDQLLLQRKVQFSYLRLHMEKTALKYKEHLLVTPHNNISIGISLKSLIKQNESKNGIDPAASATQLGSMLFSRNIQGTRVVVPSETQQIGSIVFKGWGSHCEEYPVPYLTAASALGINSSDVDFFIKKLDESLNALTCR